ncbi:hypothetical protein ACFQXB_15600 [Plastorhodobacter daqingensis]|uniref:Uncharacterized protein n=1 Tax=Plastorhodobacter daqingensis TaxID=1387281 RepID=A0ABW2UMY4_9RHOB
MIFAGASVRQSSSKFGNRLFLKSCCACFARSPSASIRKASCAFGSKAAGSSHAANQSAAFIRFIAKEFAALRTHQTTGEFTASQIGWSGRVDPSADL